MGRVRSAKPNKQPQQPQPPPLTAQPPLNPPVEPHSAVPLAQDPHLEQDQAQQQQQQQHHLHLALSHTQSCVPTRDTLSWLYTLPLPPGVTDQPLPQTPHDWALVEQYRLLCQGLLVMGEFERERQRRVDRGEDPWADWDPRESNNPLVISAAHSLFKHDLAQQQQQYAGYPPSYPPPFPPSFPTSSFDDDAYVTEDDEAYLEVDAQLRGLAAQGAFPGPHKIPTADDETVLSTQTFDFPTLETLQSFASASPLDPSALPLSLDLSALAGTVEGAEGGPASLPSLMAAIAELEQCVARLSLEATEARNLQKSLREEMASRISQAKAAGLQPPQEQVDEPEVAGSEGETTSAVTQEVAKVLSKLVAQSGGIAGGGSGGGKKAIGGGGRKKVPGAKAVSVPSRSRLPPHVLAEITAAQQRSSAASANPPASATPQSQSQPRPRMPQDEQPQPIDPSFPAFPPPPNPECDCPSCLAAYSTAPVSGISLGEFNPEDVKSWEDGELMKALQSVSMLDRRADEYRERLRVLKEQIHHHAALADALTPSAATAAAQQSALASTDGHPVQHQQQHQQAEYESQDQYYYPHPQDETHDSEQQQQQQPQTGPYGQSVSHRTVCQLTTKETPRAQDTGLAWVSVDDRRRELAERAQEVIDQYGGEYVPFSRA
ncbi:hypothetical protein JCM11641_002019 [Rhodosporidiobolus odoratus]